MTKTIFRKQPFRARDKDYNTACDVHIIKGHVSMDQVHPLVSLPPQVTIRTANMKQTKDNGGRQPEPPTFWEVTSELIYFVVVGAVFIFGGLFEWRVNHDYIESQCIVLDKDRRYKIDYTVGGRQHQVWCNDTRSLEKELQFVVGQKYPCWYDPDAPDKVVLVRGYTMVFYFGAIFLIVGSIYIAVRCGSLLRR